MAMWLLAVAAAILSLAAVGAESHRRMTIQEAQAALALDRDDIVASLSARLAAAGTLLGALAIAVDATPASCAALLELARPLAMRPMLLGPDGTVRCGSTESRSQGEEGIRVPIRAALPGGSGMLQAEITLPGMTPEASVHLLDARASIAWQPVPADSDGAVLVTGPDGRGYIAAAGRIGPELRILVAQPEARIRHAALLEALRYLGEVAAILLLGGTMVLLGATHVMTRPLARLRAAVSRWRGGAALEIAEADNLPEELRDVAEAFREGAAALAERDNALEAAVARAELLAEEVHHRVKNNLQVVTSLLALQAGRVADPAARLEFEAARDRVGAIATLHRHLYIHHDPEAIDLRAFLQELGEQLFTAVGERPGRRIVFTVDASPLRLGTDQAVPLALLITEAVSLALKQGFPDARRGRIAIRLTARDGRAQLVVEDDGIWPRAEDKLRASLMRGFARQLGGELREQQGCLTLDFPLRAPLPRSRARVSDGTGAAVRQGSVPAGGAP